MGAYRCNSLAIGTKIALTGGSLWRSYVAGENTYQHWPPPGWTLEEASFYGIYAL